MRCNFFWQGLTSYLHCKLHKNHCDGLCIITVISVTKDEWFYILRADYLYGMTQFFKLTLPVNCPCECFDINQAGQNILYCLE